MMEKLMLDKESLGALFYPPPKIIVLGTKSGNCQNISEGDSILGSTSHPSCKNLYCTIK